jgi:hypothetical protein
MFQDSLKISVCSQKFLRRCLKSLKNILAGLFFLISIVALRAAAESGPDNGTDVVKILFAESQNELNLRLNALNKDQVRALEFESDIVRSWLLQDLDSPMGHWAQLKFYISNMRLAFQTAPCQDAQGRTASICFFNQDAGDPYVMISLQENRMTTPSQAMAMLIHEAGHFIGEKDHLFLDQVGVQLTKALTSPKSFSVTVSSVEVSANTFSGKQECEAGTSSQAISLRQQALLKLEEQCQTAGRHCDLQKAQLAFAGESVFQDGVGFTMKVRCELKAFVAAD